MISQGEGCREDVGGGGGWQHTRQTLEKSPTSKLYTTWAHILSDRNVFAPRGGGERRGPMPLGLFLFRFVFLAVWPCFAKIFRDSCVEKYKKFNGVDFSSTRARFESQ